MTTPPLPGMEAPSLAGALEPHVSTAVKIEARKAVGKLFGKALLSQLEEEIEQSSALSQFEGDMLRGLREVLTPELVEDAVIDQISEMLFPPDPPELAYANLGEFVEKYVVNVYRRNVQTSSTHRWCPEWYEHPPVVVAMQCLWSAFETYRRDPGIGPLVFHRDGLLPIMNAITHPDGPLSGCSVQQGHRSPLPPLPTKPVPPGLFVPTPAEMEGMPTAPPELPTESPLTGAADE